MFHVLSIFDRNSIVIPHKLVFPAVALAASLAMAPSMGAAAVIGYLGNFDVINDTGSTAHGFEIELEGLHSSDITDTFGGAGRDFPSGRGFDSATSVERYGAPTITEYSNDTTFGTRVTYLGLYDAAKQLWDFGTPSGTFITPGDNCWSGGGVGYGPSTPCDHFGVGTTANATKTTYSWLIETAEAGVLTNGVVNLPAPAWSVEPSPVAGVPPVVGVQIQAPAPENEAQFGEAIWVKVFTSEFEDPIDLEELVGDNARVQLAETEIEWQLLQTDPGNPEAGKLESGYGAPVGKDAASIMRRYEFFHYSGEYDPETHQAKVSISDSHPNDPNDLVYFDPNKTIDLGNYIGAQNAAANLVADVAAVPVPHAVWLFGSGLLGLIGAARRKIS